jgi:ABC-type transport system involved in cytochrome c biogenesis permease subunit
LAVLLGFVWAYQAWGGYWSWDPKETWALIVWLVYAAYLHVRLTKRPRLVVQAWWLLIGFMATLMCYIGVNMFLSGLHSYGSLAV